MEEIKKESRTPYSDRGLDPTMDRLNEYRRKNLEEIERLKALIKVKNE